MKSDPKMNGLIKNLMAISLSLELKRMPTEQELFDGIVEFYDELANMTQKEKDTASMQDRCDAFMHNYYTKVYEVTDPKYEGFLDDTNGEIEARELRRKYE